MKMLLLDGTSVRVPLECSEAYDGMTCLEYVFKQAQANKFDRYVLLQTGNIDNVPNEIKNVIVSDNSPSALINEIYANVRNCDDVVVVNAGSPFYDADFVSQCLERHTSFMADYTYSLGYPSGMVPTVVKKSILPELARLAAEEHDFHKDYLFYALSKDINSFDIETFLSKKDLRLARLTFGSDDYQTAKFTCEFFDRLKDMSFDSQIDFLADNPQLYYSLPFMVSLDVIDKCEVESSFAPKCGGSGKCLDMTDYLKLVDWVGSKAYYKMMFVFAGLGDCLLHNDILEMCETAASKNIDVVLETYAVGEQSCEAVKQICLLPDEIKTHMSVVIKLDAYNKATYDKLHKNGNFDEALSNYAILAESGVNVYKCVTRILDNEAEIEQYIRKGETDHLIIRKHSSYCGTIADQKVVDLSPFQRCPCFHLRRELAVLPSGEFVMCSFARNEIIGSLKNDTVDEIVGKQRHLYEENAKNSLNNNCKNCDEYYIFNF